MPVCNDLLKMWASWFAICGLIFAQHRDRNYQHHLTCLSLLILRYLLFWSDQWCAEYNLYYYFCVHLFESLPVFVCFALRQHPRLAKYLLIASILPCFVCKYSTFRSYTFIICHNAICSSIAIRHSLYSTFS